MGYETLVSAGVTRVFPELPNRSKDAVATALHNKTSITKAIIASSITGGSAKLRNIMNYAKGTYYYGSPVVYSSSDAGEAIPNWLYHHLYHISTHRIDAGGVPSVNMVITLYSNTTSRQFNEEVYHRYQAEQALINDVGSWDTIQALTGWDNHILTFTGHSPRIATYTYDGGMGTKSYNLSPLGSIGNDVWHIVEWKLIGDGSSESPAYKWFYKQSYNTAPLIHVINTSVLTLEHDTPPVVPIILNSARMDTASNPTIHASIEKLLGKFPLSLKEITTAIDVNDDSNLITEAFISFGVNVAVDEYWGAYALYHIFDKIRTTPATTSLAPGGTYSTPSLPAYLEDYFNSLNGSTSGNAGEEAYNTPKWVSIVEESFNSTVQYRSIEFDYAIDSAIPTGANHKIEFVKNAEYVVDTVTMPNASNNEVGYTSYKWINRLIVYIRDTEFGGVLTCTVRGLEATHIIRDKRYTVNDINEGGIVIPLFGSIVRDAPSRIRDDIFFGSAQLTTYAVQRVHVAWYETFFFQSLMFVVGLYFGAASAPGVGFGVSSSLNASIRFLAIKILTKILIDYTTKFLVDKLGSYGAVLGAALSIYASNNMSFDGTLSDLQATLSSVVRVIDEYNANELVGIQDSYTAMGVTYASRQDALEKAKEALNNQFGANITLLERGGMIRRSLPNIDSNESPTEFYERTTTTTSMSELSYSFITNYHDAHLQLPRSDSYAGTFEEFNPNRGLV